MAASGVPNPPERIALALSGGGDSVALMHLLGVWLNEHEGTRGHALIVDHGLRPGSTADAKRAAVWARRAGWHAEVLSWRARTTKSNIENAAREARYRLIGEVCRAQRVQHLFVAHTRDDQAETFLLRLGRGSGIDGLSAMRACASYPLAGFSGLSLVRPLLAFGRAELRSYLKDRGFDWLEDPMNDDTRFTRTRIREVLPALDAAGVPMGRIADAARHMARARHALETATDELLSRHARMDGPGLALVDAQALVAAPREIGLRALSSLLRSVSGADYRPRFTGLEAVFDGLTAQGDMRARTLHGCRIGAAPARLKLLGPATLEIRKESARKPRNSRPSTKKPIAKMPSGRKKLPNKGRNSARK